MRFGESIAGITSSLRGWLHEAEPTVTLLRDHMRKAHSPIRMRLHRHYLTSVFGLVQRTSRTRYYMPIDKSVFILCSRGPAWPRHRMSVSISADELWNAVLGGPRATACEERERGALQWRSFNLCPLRQGSIFKSRGTPQTSSPISDLQNTHSQRKEKGQTGMLFRGRKASFRLNRSVTKRANLHNLVFCCRKMEV